MAEQYDEDQDGLEHQLPTHGFKSVYEMMNSGDKTLQNFREDQILLVGLSRIGKSTTMNWILRNPMMGVQKNGQVIYVNVGKEGALVVDGVISVTLIANKGTLDGVDILDMAGYGDTRDHIGVFGVSYCLQRVLSQGNRFKFLLVINQEAFRTGSKNDVIKTFQSFLSMFRFKNMPQEVKKCLFNSVALLITRANDVYKRQKIIQSFLEELNSPASRITSKDLICELLSVIYKQNKIIDFMIAQPNLECPECKAIENLNQRNWSYFELKRFDIQIPHQRGSYVMLPFKKQFQRLSGREKINFNNAIEKKINSFKEFTKIIVKFLQIAIQSQFQAHINYQPFFQLIRQFLLEYDHYNSQRCIQATDLSNIPAQKTEIKLNKMIRELILTCVQTRQKTYGQSTKDYMEIYLYGRCRDIINLFFITVCAAAEEERLILSFKYVVLRSFKELTTISDIDKEQGAAAYTSIFDSIINAQPIDCPQANQIYQDFFLNIRPHFKSPIFKSIAFKIELDDYSDQFLLDVADIKSPNKFRLFKYELKKYICMDHKKNANYQSAIRYAYAGGKQLLIDLEERINKSGLIGEELNKDNEINKECRKIHEIFYHIVDCLLKGKFQMHLALKICLYMKDTTCGMNVYSQMVNKEEESEDQTKMKAILEEYAQYCASNGFLQKAQQLLMKRKNIEFDSSQQIDRIIEKMHYLQDHQMDKKAQARENFSSKVIFKLSDYEMTSILDAIQDFIDNPPTSVTVLSTHDSPTKVPYQNEESPNIKKQLKKA